MDPNACLDRAERALHAGDWCEAYWALADFRGWIDGGGFMPPDGERRAFAHHVGLNLAALVVRKHYERRVLRPGKFELEPSWVPYVWERIILHGFASETLDDGEEVYDFVTIEADLAALFPDLADETEVCLYAQSNGFVRYTDPVAVRDRYRTVEGDAR